MNIYAELERGRALELALAEFISKANKLCPVGEYYPVVLEIKLSHKNYNALEEYAHERCVYTNVAKNKDFVVMGAKILCEED